MISQKRIIYELGKYESLKTQGVKFIRIENIINLLNELKELDKQV